MRLARLSFATLAVIALAACSNDATGPVTDDGAQITKGPASPTGPMLSNGQFGSGAKSASDSLLVSVSSTSTSSSTGPV